MKQNNAIIIEMAAWADSISAQAWQSVTPTWRAEVVAPYNNTEGQTLLVEAAILSSRIRIQVRLYKRRQQAAALRRIRKGSPGANVEALQILLYGKGYKCGEVDGDFGTKTDAAVKKYQGAKGLTQDGVVGKQTWGKLIG